MANRGEGKEEGFVLSELRIVVFNAFCFVFSAALIVEIPFDVLSSHVGTRLTD